MKGGRLEGTSPGPGGWGKSDRMGRRGSRTHRKLLENWVRKLFIRKPVCVPVVMVTEHHGIRKVHDVRRK